MTTLREAAEMALAALAHPNFQGAEEAEIVLRSALKKSLREHIPEPLTDEEIMANAVLRYHFALNGGEGPISKQGRKIIDAIEAAHGIKGKE